MATPMGFDIVATVVDITLYIFQINIDYPLLAEPLSREFGNLVTQERLCECCDDLTNDAPGEGIVHQTLDPHSQESKENTKD